VREFLKVDETFCCQCGYCASVAPGEFDPVVNPGLLIAPSTTALLAMAECPNSAIVWVQGPEAAEALS
jgi:ferredoxin